LVASLVSIIAFVLLLGIAAIPIWFCQKWVLGPLDRAARGRRGPTQFFLADMFSLFVLVQVPLAMILGNARGLEAPSILALTVTAGVLVAGAGSVWWFGVRTLSRAGIGVVWQRFIVVSAVIPVAFVGSLSVVFLPLFAMGLGNIWLILVEIIVICVLYGLGRFVRWIVATAEARETVSLKQEMEPQMNAEER